jgi:hypothetical protein
MARREALACLQRHDTIYGSRLSARRPPSHVRRGKQQTPDAESASRQRRVTRPLPRHPEEAALFRCAIAPLFERAQRGPRRMIDKGSSFEARAAPSHLRMTKVGDGEERMIVRLRNAPHALPARGIIIPRILQTKARYGLDASGFFPYITPAEAHLHHMACLIGLPQIRGSY